MIRSLQKHFYNAQIHALLVLSPATLFQKISQLDWYRNTLQAWINPHLNGESLRVLDIGCATGYLTEDIYGMGHDVSGIDISPRMIHHATQRNAAIDFQVADARKLPFENETFDLAVSAFLINVTQHADDIVQEMYRVCKKGGILTLLFPIKDANENEFLQHKTTFGLSPFSEAAFVAWHRLSPKKSIHAVTQHLINSGFSPCKTHTYLNGMMASVSAVKS